MVFFSIKRKSNSYFSPILRLIFKLLFPSTCILLYNFKSINFSAVDFFLLPVYLVSKVQHLNHLSWQISFPCWLFVIQNSFPTGLKKIWLALYHWSWIPIHLFCLILVLITLLSCNFDFKIPSLYNPRLFNS